MGQPPNDLDAMLRPLQDHEGVTELGPDQERRAARGAERMPLVHRTGAPEHANRWRTILAERCLATMEPAADNAVQQHIGPASYFFLGHPSYPKGAVAFIFANETAGTFVFTPFDTGALNEPLLHPSDDRPWEIADRLGFIDEHTGDGADVQAFTRAYLMEHFADPMDYMRRPQRSLPDVPPYHGLQSDSDDRRAWTIEMRSEAPVDLDANEPPLDGIVVAGRELLADMPSDLLPLVRSIGDEEDVTAGMARTIMETWVEPET